MGSVRENFNYTKILLVSNKIIIATYTSDAISSDQLFSGYWAVIILLFVAIISVIIWKIA